MSFAALDRAVETKAVNIGTWAYMALLEEVYVSPKPGLVDLYSNGAHRDMDVYTFERSASGLLPYFIKMALQGLGSGFTGEELFRQLRKTGQDAEQAMYRATGGINTHKGAVFTLGLYCAAAGRCLSKYGAVGEEYLRKIQIEITEESLNREIRMLGQKKAASHGEKNFQSYGTMGVRGEALKGYPSLWEVSLPVFRQGIACGLDMNSVKLQTLLTLMSRIEDSNIIARHDPDTLRKVQKDAERFLLKGGVYTERGFRKLAAMDREYTIKNISPGGSADLLAATIFLEKILRNCRQ